MRMIPALLLAVAWLLTACGGDPVTVPTVTPLGIAAGGAGGDVAGQVVVTRAPETPIGIQAGPTEEGALPIPLPGTLVASETQDPNMGQPFQVLSLFRTGGPVPDAADLDLTIFGDGAFLVNGVPGALPPEALMDLNAAIDEINFFGLQGTMLGLPSSTDYTYRLTINRAGTERMIASQDGFMPTAYKQLIGRLVSIALDMGG
jgi:hypothetical protein